MYAKTGEYRWLSSPAGSAAARIVYTIGLKLERGVAGTSSWVCPVVSLQSSFIPNVSN